MARIWRIPETRRTAAFPLKSMGVCLRVEPLCVHDADAVIRKFWMFKALTDPRFGRDVYSNRQLTLNAAKIG